jgi:hypothetical protein
MALGPEIVNEVVAILGSTCRTLFDPSCQQQLQGVLGEPAVSLETRYRLNKGPELNLNKRWIQAFAVGALLFAIALKWMMDQPTTSQPAQAFPSKIHLASTEVESLLSMTAGTGVAIPTATSNNDLATITVIATPTNALVPCIFVNLDKQADERTAAFLKHHCWRTTRMTITKVTSPSHIRKTQPTA